MPTTPKNTVLLMAMAMALIAGQAKAAADPAAGKVEVFDNALLEAMKSGVGADERYRRLEPVVGRVFDLPTMTSFAVGPAWSSFTPAQQQATIAAFARLTIASFAHNFESYGGEQFQIDPNVVTRGPDKIVQTHLIRPHDSPVSLLYRMRESDGSWKVIDVYFDGISQLTTRRSDFAASVASGGEPVLLDHLTALSNKLMR